MSQCCLLLKRRGDKGRGGYGTETRGKCGKVIEPCREKQRETDSRVKDAQQDERGKNEVKVDKS